MKFAILILLTATLQANAAEGTCPYRDARDAQLKSRDKVSDQVKALCDTHGAPVAAKPAAAQTAPNTGH